MIWKKLVSSEDNYLKFLLEDEPEVLHIIKSGFENRYFYFIEDAYQLDPWLNGIKLEFKETIEKKFNILL